MDDIVISARGVSKAFTITHHRHGATTLAEAVARWVANPFQRGKRETFWALRDVSFEVARGEVVGIIGRNGAGKSTLLKILSQITGPTTGEIDLYGRVGSLLEVGTGFHPELTGRENIYLNGAILGMRRREIDRQFDAIVAFAETEAFLDTPVKRYSSGMYVRLAFAVAAHLNPEILIVDEVLAVGDADFQKKCLGKMGDVAREEGRTVLFVSHNMPAVSSLCPRTILIERGRMVAFEATPAVIGRYLASGRLGRYENDNPEREKGEAFIRRAWIETAPRAGREGKTTGAIVLGNGDEFTLKAVLCVRSAQSFEFIASFYDHLRRPLWYFTNTLFAQPPLPKGDSVEVSLRYHLPRLSVPNITVDIAVTRPGVFPPTDMVLDALAISITGDETAPLSCTRDYFPLVLPPAFETRLA